MCRQIDRKTKTIAHGNRYRPKVIIFCQFSVLVSLHTFVGKSTSKTFPTEEKKAMLQLFFSKTVLFITYYLVLVSRVTRCFCEKIAQRQQKIAQMAKFCPIWSPCWLGIFKYHVRGVSLRSLIVFQYIYRMSLPLLIK
jgi:hypothetical protein